MTQTGADQALTDEQIDAVFLALPRADGTGQTLWRSFARAILAAQPPKQTGVEALQERIDAGIANLGNPDTRDIDPALLSQVDAALSGAPALGQSAEVLTWIMRRAESAKEPCESDPESPTAIRNGALASIASAAAQALGLVRGPSYAAPPVGQSAAPPLEPVASFPYEPAEPSDEARRAWKAHYGPEINTADANRSFDEFFAGWYAARQPREVGAAPPLSVDVRDARRYRWLRTHRTLLWADGGRGVAPFPAVHGASLDSSIDAALAEQAGPSSFVGSIPAEETDAEFAAQVKAMDHPTEAKANVPQAPAGGDEALKAWRESARYRALKVADALEAFGRAEPQVTALPTFDALVKSVASALDG